MVCGMSKGGVLIPKLPNLGHESEVFHLRLCRWGDRFNAQHSLGCSSNLTVTLENKQQRCKAFTYQPYY
jgi:hypothetical protein